MKKLAWSVTAVVVAAGFVAGVPVTRHAILNDNDKDDTVQHVAAIKWGACPKPAAGVKIDPKQTCGTLRVPLDYQHPDGKKITLAVSRIKAADPAKRRGVLLLNPGGPGGEGLDLPSSFPGGKSVLDAYDRIGFDPRGIGHSTPVTCGLTDADLTPPYPFPGADGSIAKNVAKARTTASRCAKKSGDEMPYITTKNTARDMDQIRQALGEKKVSYWGTSYGTYLGAAYASMYPDQTDRIVLDSAVDPGKVWHQQFAEQATGMALRFPDVAGYAAAHNDQVGFGATPKAVTASYLDLASRLDKKPVAIPGVATRMTGDELRFITFGMLSQDQTIAPLTQVWRAVDDLSAGHATGQETGMLQQVMAQSSPSAAVSPGVPKDNTIAGAYAIACDDVKWPKNVDTYAAEVKKDQNIHPLTDGFPSNVWPCAFWKNSPVEAPVKISAAGPHNILVVQNRRDPNTPLVSGQAMRKALGKRATMVTVDAGGHVVYGTQGPDSCSAKAIDAFLADGTMPAEDTTCAKA